MGLIILAGDAHLLLREGMCHLVRQLESDVRILEADDFAAMLQHAESVPDLDLALMALNLPGGEDSQSIRVWQKRFPHIPLVVLCETAQRGEVEAALTAGARGVIPMTLSGKTLLGALRIVLCGGTYVPPQVLRDCRAMATDGGSHADGPDGAKTPQLTPRRADVLKFLAAGVSNKEIARTMNLSEGTIKCHVAAILRTLHVSTRKAAVETARNAGMISG